jgi:hypothetical protein
MASFHRTQKKTHVVLASCNHVYQLFFYSFKALPYLRYPFGFALEIMYINKLIYIYIYKQTHKP